MDSEEVPVGELVVAARGFDRCLHGGDVAQYLDSYLVRCITTEGECGFGVEETSRRGVKSFDSRRRHRFRT